MNLANQFILSAIQLLPKPLVKRFAMRYIAGEKLDDAVRVVRAVNSKHMMGTMDVLGENVSTRKNLWRRSGSAKKFFIRSIKTIWTQISLLN